MEFLISLKTAFTDGRGRFSELMLFVSSFIWSIAIITSPIEASFNTRVLSDLIWFGFNGTMLAMPWLVVSILHIIGLGFLIFPIRAIACALSLGLWSFVCVKIALLGAIEGYLYPPCGVYVAMVISATRGLVWDWLRKS